MNDSSEDGDCQVNVADDVLSLSVISKSINTSYINLKRHNPLMHEERKMTQKLDDLRDIACPEIIQPKLLGRKKDHQWMN